MAYSLSISVTTNSQSVADNTSNVTVKVNCSWTYGTWSGENLSKYCTINGTTHYFSSTDINPNQTTSGSSTLFTWTGNIAHNSDGTKTLSVYASTKTTNSSGTQTASKSVTLKTIPRKSTLSVANGTLGTAQTLTITEKASTFKHKLKYECGNASPSYILGGSDSFSTSNSVSWTPPLSLASQKTDGTSVSIKFTLYTYTSGGTSIGSNSYTKTFSIPSSVKPSCSVAVTDPTGYADTYGGFLKGLSKFKVVVTPTTSYGSAIASYSTTANGSTYTTSSFTTDVLKSTGTLAVKATVKDKRGRTGTATVNKTVLDYAAPSITSLKVRRCNSDGTENQLGDHVQVTFSSKVTSLNSKNTAAYKLEYKKKSATSYTPVTLSDYANNYAVSNGTYIFAADTGSSYDVKMTVTDDFESRSNTTVASTGFAIMHWLASGLGLALGKIAELSGVLDIGFQTRFFGGILQPVLEVGTDFNTVLTPNTYTLKNASSASYANCPFTTGTGTLKVEAAGESGQVHQIAILCDKTKSITYERYYYGGSWGAWVKTFDWTAL